MVYTKYNWKSNCFSYRLAHPILSVSKMLAFIKRDLTTHFYLSVINYIVSYNFCFYLCFYSGHFWNKIIRKFFLYVILRNMFWIIYQETSRKFHSLKILRVDRSVQFCPFNSPVYYYLYFIFNFDQTWLQNNLLTPGCFGKSTLPQSNFFSTIIFIKWLRWLLLTSTLPYTLFVY